MIPAVIAVCLLASPSQCETHDLRIEARACRITPLRAEAPVGGVWQPVVVSVRCQKG